MHTAFSEHLLTLFSRHFHLAVVLAVALMLLFLCCHSQISLSCCFVILLVFLPSLSLLSSLLLFY